MKMICAIVRPHRLEQVKHALSDVGVVGLTVSEVRGAGRQKGQVERYRGSEYSFDLIPKVKVEAAVPDEQCAEALKAICAAARTGRSSSTPSRTRCGSAPGRRGRTPSCSAFGRPGRGRAPCP